MVIIGPVNMFKDSVVQHHPSIGHDWWGRHDYLLHWSQNQLGFFVLFPSCTKYLPPHGSCVVDVGPLFSLPFFVT